MSGYLIVLLCNMVLYGLVRWFSDAEFLKRFGHHRILEVIAFGLFCVTLYMFGILNGALAEEVEHVPGKLEFNAVVLVLAILTGVPWAVAYARLVLDTSSGVADTIYGLNSILLDKADLKAAHKHLVNGDRREAIGELNFQRQKYPDAYSPLFLLAILAEEDKNFDKAVDLYREIIQKHADDMLPWTNAAGNLAELLRREYNDEAGAKHLEAEILKRNPDTKHKYSTTAAPPKKKKSKKNRNMQLEKADITQARRMITRGEFIDAITLIKRYIAENPEDARAHFELISIFERLDRTDDAIIWLQKVIRNFGDNDQAWGDAMIRLAGLREHGEQDLEAAISLLEQIAQRLKHAKHGKLAREQLLELRDKKQL